MPFGGGTVVVPGGTAQGAPMGPKRKGSRKRGIPRSMGGGGFGRRRGAMRLNHSPARA